MSENSNHLILIETVQCTAIRTLFEALKEIITDTNIYFDNRGMKIEALDESKIALVWMRLFADKFERYQCSVEKLKVGVSVIALWKLLKTMGGKDSLKITIDADNPNIMNIYIRNEEKNRDEHNQYRLLEIPENVMEIPAKEFDWYIQLPSHDFQDICRSMRDVGQTIEIMDYKRQLTFECHGDYATKKCTISETETNGLSYVAEEGVDMNQIIRGRFAIKYLLMFTKATGLCNEVQIYLTNDYPMILRYTVANLGELKFVIAQIDDEA